MNEGWWMAGSIAWNGASSRMAAYSERQPTSGLWAIKRFPGLRTRPCVSRTVKIGFSDPVTHNLRHGERLSAGLHYTQAAPTTQNRRPKPTFITNHRSCAYPWFELAKNKRGEPDTQRWRRRSTATAAP